jgi:hypothetical protein
MLFLMERLALIPLIFFPLHRRWYDESRQPVLFMGKKEALCGLRAAMEKRF